MQCDLGFHDYKIIHEILKEYFDGYGFNTQVVRLLECSQCEHQKYTLGYDDGAL